MSNRLYGALAAAVLSITALAPSGFAAPAPCVPLVVDDRGDTDPILPRERQDLDILSVDVLTSADVRRLSFVISLASLPDLPAEAAGYDVFFKAGKRSYLASGHRGLDEESFRLESDEPTRDGLANVQPIAGSFDLDDRTVRLDIPLRLVSDGAKPLRRGSVVYGITAVTVDSYGARSAITVGTTHDSTSNDNIYRLGARGCARA